MAGFMQKLGDALTGTDRAGARRQGQMDRANYDTVMAQAEQRRQDALRSEALTLRDQEKNRRIMQVGSYTAEQLRDPNNPDLPLGDLLVSGLAPDYNTFQQSRLRGQEFGHRETIADHELPFDQRQAAAQAQSPAQLAAPQGLGDQVLGSGPASVQEYNLAASQGFPGTFEDWVRQRHQRFSVVEYGGQRYMVDNTGVAPPRQLSTLQDEAQAELIMREAGRGRLPGDFAPTAQGAPMEPQPQQMLPGAPAEMGGGGGFAPEGAALPVGPPQAPQDFAPQMPQQQQREPLRFEALPGTAAHQEQQAAEMARSARQRSAQQMLERRVPGVLRDVTRAIEQADKAGPTAGVVATPEEGAGMMRRMAAARSPAYELNQHLESIKSNISIEELQSMREASPTGGALGQIPVRQQEFLMQMQGSLNPQLRPEVLRENLSFVHNNYLRALMDAVYGDPQELAEAVRIGRMTEEQADAAQLERQQIEQQYTRETEFGQFGERRGQDGGAGQPPRISSDAEYEALPSGTVFIAPDGTRRRKP